jgi:hypothetical protein
MRVRTLLLLFLAAFLSDSSEAQCTATNCTVLPAVYPGAGNGTVFALAHAQYQIQTALNGRALKVGAFSIAPSYAPTQRGLDGFVQFNPSSNFTVVTSAPYGSAVEVGPLDIVGAVPSLFSQAASSNNLSISWYVIRLPTSLEVGDQTKQTLWALNTLGMDVVLNPISMSPGRLAYLNLMPLQNFGYQLVVPRPVAQPFSQLDKWFLWTKPFSGRLWGIICASVFGGGMLMLLFDAGQGSESLDKENLGSPLETVGHSMYLSAMGQLLHESHDPASSSGRAYLLGNALSNFLLVAIYIATLTAWLSAGPRFSVPPATINDVMTQQLPLCIRNLTAQITWMSVYYPTLPSSLYVLTGTSSNSVLEGVNAGSCAAGLSTSTDLAAFLSPLEDPTGIYCNLKTSGPILQGGAFYGIAFGNTLPFQPLYWMFFQQISGGNYTSMYAAEYMPQESGRTQCAAQIAAEAAILAPAQANVQLDIGDVAGVFVVQAVAAGAALVLFVTKPLRKKLWPPHSQRRVLEHALTSFKMEHRMSKRLEREASSGEEERREKE